ncbi:hypothetical protein M885DRAFT_74490 [Pelagophyceae sp. CCMP2097]|nr:hypothetical protein M885DRAFT_74490 [Pelagophyceae sp. CCMP2097]
MVVSGRIALWWVLWWAYTGVHAAGKPAAARSGRDARGPARRRVPPRASTAAPRGRSDRAIECAPDVRGLPSFEGWPTGVNAADVNTTAPLLQSCVNGDGAKFRKLYKGAFGPDQHKPPLFNSEFFQDVSCRFYGAHLTSGCEPYSVGSRVGSGARGPRGRRARRGRSRGGVAWTLASPTFPFSTATLRSTSRDCSITRRRR